MGTQFSYKLEKNAFLRTMNFKILQRNFQPLENFYNNQKNFYTHSREL